MAFMEATLGEGFLNDLDLRHPMAMLMMEVICHAASTREWGDKHSLPEPVLARTLQVLGELYENVSDFLAGEQDGLCAPLPLEQHTPDCIVFLWLESSSCLQHDLLTILIETADHL